MSIFVVTRYFDRTVSNNVSEITSSDKEVSDLIREHVKNASNVVNKQHANQGFSTNLISPPCEAIPTYVHLNSGEEIKGVYYTNRKDRFTVFFVPPEHLASFQNEGYKKIG